LPTYGRSADFNLQNTLCAMDMFVAPELHVYLLYLQNMSRYHEGINADTLKMPGEDARMNAEQITDLCDVLSTLALSSISVEDLFTKERLDEAQGSALTACLRRIARRRAEAQCLRNWQRVANFVSRTTRYEALQVLLDGATYAPDYDTMCIPKEIIADEFAKDKGKELIKAYEQLCAIALLFNANKDLPGRGEFKKMPIYGRGADETLQKSLCEMDMYVVPEMHDYLLYLQNMSRYHETISAAKLRTPDEDARMSAAQIKELCEIISGIEGNQVDVEGLFTDECLNNAQSKALTQCLQKIVLRRFEADN